jgi:hypothetical protein
MRNKAMLAVMIEKGILRFDPNTPCTTEGCDNPLLVSGPSEDLNSRVAVVFTSNEGAMAFNALSRIDGKYICERCREWEANHGTKYSVFDERVARIMTPSWGFDPQARAEEKRKREELDQTIADAAVGAWNSVAKGSREG